MKPVSSLWRVLTINVPAVNGLRDDPGRLAIHLASDTVSSAQDFLHSALKLLGERLVAHRPGNLDDLVETDRLVVLNVLLLLAVARRLLQRPDNEGRRGRDNRHRSLAVLDGELNGHAQAFLDFLCQLSASEVGTRLTQSPVAFAMSSPTFFGDKPSGPILGARAEEAPTSPPVARRWL